MNGLLYDVCCELDKSFDEQTIPIYEYEAQAGLNLQNRSIAYVMPVEKWQPNGHATASQYDNDLYYTKSILVTTNWNKNDDVFDKNEVWAARNTPVDKPTNIEHNDNHLIGHITSCHAMTRDKLFIPDNTLSKDLPEVYHLVVGSVIYRGLKDKELSATAENLIQEIEQGKKFVSMECSFTNFDYAMLDNDGKTKILGRDDNSSFLTKHLRAYGGDGLYNGCKIGRLLRNITFSGKGYVDKPANPDSIVFDI